MFISDGINAVVWEFQQHELGPEFTRALWDMLLRDDDTSTVLMRFVWNVPLGPQAQVHPGARRPPVRPLPDVRGLSEDWPAGNAIPPYIREPRTARHDFDLVNQGYLGYLNLGYTRREVDLLVWLEALRDKQCEEKPCEMGIMLAGRAEPKGGCPVKIHIPEMLELLGTAGSARRWS